MKKVVAVLAFLGCLGVSSPVLAQSQGDSGSSTGVRCWIPIDRPITGNSPSVSRQRSNGQWEVLMTTGLYEAFNGGEQSLCVEVLPGMYVYRGDVEDVQEYLASLNGKVKFYGEFVTWTPMLHTFGLLASCESNGDWGINTRNGYLGGLQIDVEWFVKYEVPWPATIEQQLDLAYKVWDAHEATGEGSDGWANCATRVGVR